MKGEKRKVEDGGEKGVEIDFGNRICDLRRSIWICKEVPGWHLLNFARISFDFSSSVSICV